VVPPPEAGEVATIESLEQEWKVLNPEVLGTIIIGDINIHHRKWLRYSNRNSAEGERLKTFCDGAGLRQVVKEPTRGEYLLDLVFTDLDELRYKSLPKIADHIAILGTLPLPVPQEVTQTRTVWQFAAAEWECLKDDLANQDWALMQDMDAHEGELYLTSTILSAASRYIPQRTMHEHKSTHPWVNARVQELVEGRKTAQGSSREEECTKACSKGIMEEYGKYVARERNKLQ
jgi:hypothetical protein